MGYTSFTALDEEILFEKQREGDQLGLGGRELPSGLGGKFWTGHWCPSLRPTEARGWVSVRRGPCIWG